MDSHACRQLTCTLHFGCFHTLCSWLRTTRTFAQPFVLLGHYQRKRMGRVLRLTASCTTATTLFLPRRVSPPGSFPTKTGRHMGPPLHGVALIHPNPRWMARHRPYSLFPPIHLPRRPIDPKSATTRPPSSPRLESRPDISDFHRSAIQQNHP